MSKEDMIALGGLLFRTRVDADKSQFVMIPRMLKDLVPADQQKIMTAEDWKKVILKPLIYFIYFKYVVLYVLILFHTKERYVLKHILNIALQK